jgi:hypothetical protein
MLGLAGVTAIETRLAEVTDNTEVPLIAPAVAVIVVWPLDMLVAIPLFPIAATVGVDGEALQVTALLRFCWLPSENVPVAVKD